MISKVTRGGDMRGLMRYLVGPGKHNEHTSPHLVAGSSGVMAWWDDAELNADEAAQIGAMLDKPRTELGVQVMIPAKEFDPATGQMVDAGRRPGHVWHCSLSLGADEGAIGDEKWGAIASRFIELMDINDGVRSEARWVAVHHGQSTAGNDHIHLVVGLVREDGTKISTHRDYARTQQACATIEQEFGLQVIESRTQGRGQAGLSRAELRRTGTGEELERRWLERVVSGAAIASRSEDEFVRRVRSSGALVRPRFAAGGQDKVVGYSVAKRTKKGTRPVWLGGGQVGHDLTLPRLREGWDIAGDEAAFAEWRAAWRGVKPVGRGPEVRTPSAETWHRAVDELTRLADQLHAVPLDDQATWTRVARQVGGALSVWSTRIEPEPGPLADAAGKVRDYARVRRAPTTSDQGPRVSLTAQAYLLAAVATKPDSLGAQLAMIKQLTRTLRALHDAQERAGQARTARGTEVAVKTHLHAWRKQLERAALESTPEGQQALAAAELTRKAAAPARTDAPLPGIVRGDSTASSREPNHSVEQGSSRE